MNWIIWTYGISWLLKKHKLFSLWNETTTHICNSIYSQIVSIHLTVPYTKSDEKRIAKYEMFGLFYIAKSNSLKALCIIYFLFRSVQSQPTDMSALGSAAASRSTEIEDAINYMRKIKERVKDDPDTYREFLSILKDFRYQRYNFNRPQAHILISL